MFHVKRGKRRGTRPASRVAPFCSSAHQRKQRGRQRPPRCVVSLYAGTHLCIPLRQGLEIGVVAVGQPADQPARNCLGSMFHMKRALFAAARRGERMARWAAANARFNSFPSIMRQVPQPVSAFDDPRTFSYVQSRCIDPRGSLRDQLQTISIRPTRGVASANTEPTGSPLQPDRKGSRTPPPQRQRLIASRDIATGVFQPPTSTLPPGPLRGSSTPATDNFMAFQ